MSIYTCWLPSKPDENWLCILSKRIYAINNISFIICKSRKWISKQKFVKVGYKSNDIILMQTHTKTYFIERQRMERNAIKWSLWFCRNPLITGTSFRSVDINHKKFGKAQVATWICIEGSVLIHLATEMFHTNSRINIWITSRLISFITFKKHRRLSDGIHPKLKHGKCLYSYRVMYQEFNFLLY